MASQELTRSRITILALGLLVAASLYLQGEAAVPILATAHAGPQPVSKFVPTAAVCPEGFFCGKRDGFATGCPTQTCCGGGQTYCAGAAQSPSAFDKYKRSSSGTCISFSGDLVVVCSSIECTGGADGFCDGTCLGNGELTQISMGTPKFGGSCEMIGQ